MLRDRLSRCDRSTTWRVVEQIPLQFNAFHPQGMVVSGDRIYLSSVEIREPTRRLAVPIDGLDRTPGEGVGHLFVVDRSGTLVADVVLGEDDCYHPGGIDHDGAAVWVPVAEYRPDSRAVIYRVCAEDLTVQRRFVVADHIGGVLCDIETGTLAGQSWASRRFYRWASDGSLHHVEANPSHYVDYQDGQYLVDVWRCAAASPNCLCHQDNPVGMSWVGWLWSTCVSAGFIGSGRCRFGRPEDTC